MIPIFMTIMTNMVLHVKISNISHDHYKNVVLHMTISSISQRLITNCESTTNYHRSHNRDFSVFANQKLIPWKQFPIYAVPVIFPNLEKKKSFFLLPLCMYISALPFPYLLDFQRKNCGFTYIACGSK